MFRYSAFALTIDSELELPGLPISGGEPELTIRLGKVARTKAKATMADEVAITCDVGRFHLRGGREIIVDPLPARTPTCCAACCWEGSYPFSCGSAAGYRCTRAVSS